MVEQAKPTRSPKAKKILGLGETDKGARRAWCYGVGWVVCEEFGGWAEEWRLGRWRGPGRGTLEFGKGEDQYRVWRDEGTVKGFKK